MAADQAAFQRQLSRSELPLLVRILVRNVAGGVTKPKLIDHLWNDSIDLAEVHVRDRKIVNEIRRSTHHAIGRGTQSLASAYLAFLETGDTEHATAVGVEKEAAKACACADPRLASLSALNSDMSTMKKKTGRTDPSAWIL